MLTTWLRWIFILYIHHFECPSLILLLLSWLLFISLKVSPTGRRDDGTCQNSCLISQSSIHSQWQFLPDLIISFFGIITTSQPRRLEAIFDGITGVGYFRYLYRGDCLRIYLGSVLSALAALFAGKVHDSLVLSPSPLQGLGAKGMLRCFRGRADICER